jgi:hypothetical protein
MLVCHEAAGKGASMSEGVTAAKVRAAAREFQFANLMVGLAALCWVVTAVAAGRQDTTPLAPYVATVAVLGVIVTPLVLALVAYRLARSIDAGSPILWAVGSALGCVGVIVLLQLSSTATKWFTKQGLKVSLLGPTPASLDAFEAAQGQAPSPSRPEEGGPIHPWPSSGGRAARAARTASANQALTPDGQMSGKHPSLRMV